MDYKDNWIETQEKFKLWWQHKNTGRPLFHLMARREDKPAPPSPQRFFANPEELYFSAEKRCAWYERYAESHVFLAEAFPNVNLDYGATSAALYLGSEPECHWDTLWYRHISDEAWQALHTSDISTSNLWRKRHYDLLTRGKELAAGRYLVTIPDIGCSMDVMSLLRGSQELIYDLVDEPERMQCISQRLTDFYLETYDACYNMVKEPDGSSAFVAFKVWGPGKVAKLECDFCALMNHEMFRAFAMPALQKQVEHMDNAFYHLDGPDAIKHLDDLLTLPKLKAVQWTHGAGNPDGLWEGWQEKIYDKVMASGKSLYLFVEDTDPDTVIPALRRLVNRYGTHGLFVRFLNEMSLERAQKILRAFPD